MTPRWLGIVGSLAAFGMVGPTWERPPEPIDAIGWLAGCWEATSGEVTIEEQWTLPRGRIMLGVNRILRRDRLVGFEFLMLDGRDTALAYIAYPNGQSPTAFPAEVLTDRRAVFANPAHDYPQRIGYARLASDSLLAWIEGPREGTTQRTEFRYGLVSCPGA